MGIDLSKLGLRVLKSEPAKATVSAVILSKNDPALVEKAVESLKQAGLELPHVSSYEDGTVAIAQDDKFSDEGTFIRMNKDYGVMLKNFNEHNVIMKSSTIGKDAELTGAFDGVNVALAFLSEQIHTVLKSDGDRASELKEVLADFYTYVDSLAAVPAAVYKAEQSVTDLVTGFQEEVVEKQEEVKPEEEKKDEAAPAAEEQKVEKEEPAAEEKKEEVKPEEAEKPAEPVEKNDAPAKNEQLDAVLQAVQSLTATVGGLSETVQKLSGEVTEVKKTTEEKLADVVRKTETAERVLKGTVIGSSVPGDPENESTVVKKQDDDPRTGVFDTAYLRFSR